MEHSHPSKGEIVNGFPISVLFAHVVISVLRRRRGTRRSKDAPMRSVLRSQSRAIATMVGTRRTPKTAAATRKTHPQALRRTNQKLQRSRRLIISTSEPVVVKPPIATAWPKE